MNRKYKWLPHEFLKQYEVSLYIDANVVLRGNPGTLMEEHVRKNPIALPMSPSRSCVYDEAEACVRYNKTGVIETYKQMSWYRSQDYPKNNGLTANRVLFRRHLEPDVISLMKEHWIEFNRWDTKRDQLSFPFSVWKSNARVTMIGLNKNEFFDLKKHKTKQKSFEATVLSLFKKYYAFIVKYGLLKIVFLIKRI